MNSKDGEGILYDEVYLIVLIRDAR